VMRSAAEATATTANQAPRAIPLLPMEIPSAGQTAVFRLQSAPLRADWPHGSTARRPPHSCTSARLAKRAETARASSLRPLPSVLLSFRRGHSDGEETPRPALA